MFFISGTGPFVGGLNANIGEFGIGNNVSAGWSASGLKLSSTGLLQMTNGLLSGTNDTGISRDAAGIIDFGNGVAASKTAFLRSGMTVQVAADFTTANNTNLQTITGLSWTLPNTGTLTFSFDCELAYSQASGNAVVAFGIQAASAAPTNIFAKGDEQITVGPPSTFASGVLPTLTTTTATKIVSGTPTAIATNYTVHLAGTIENPATTANTINMMTSTATGTDAVTVKRGSFCSLRL
jgi:hypothetical protein